MRNQTGQPAAWIIENKTYLRQGCDPLRKRTGAAAPARSRRLFRRRRASRGRAAARRAPAAADGVSVVNSFCG